MGTRIAVSLLFLSLAGSPLSFAAQGADRPILHLRDFAEDPSLVAKTGQIVILDGPAGTNSHWNSGTNISSANTPASYQDNATYTPASTNPICTDDPIWDVGNNYRTARKHQWKRANQ